MTAPVLIVPFMKVSGMALFPFIFLKDKAMLADRTIVDHERIHLRQQAELLVLPFYILYLFNYLINRLRGQGHDRAYRNIVFEREAYENEHNPMYLSSRNWFSWRCYL